MQQGQYWLVLEMARAGTDLRIGQIGHGLGPCAFGGLAQLFLWRLNIN